MIPICANAWSPMDYKLFGRIYRLLWAETPGKMGASETERNMRIDGVTGPKLISAEEYKRQDVGWTPEWLTRHFIDGPSHKPRQQSSPSKLGALGHLEVSLARDERDIKRLQKLRYEIFYGHGRAVGNLATRLTRRDKDYFDEICDHLMVVDRSRWQWTAGRPSVIGTYRLLRQDVAEKHGDFYSAREFDISGLLQRHAGLRFLELGRSCVLPAYRSRRAIELLWHGVWSYVREHRIDVMIGCASFEGTDIGQLRRPLSLLHHFARAPEPWRAAARSLRQVEMNMMPRSEIDMRRAWRELPPLIKGYLRVGAFVCDGAVIDPQFGTTDVLIVLPVAAINSRYASYFGMDAQRYAAA
jgi:L-ornithine Nalpha-acyltransferase